MSYETDPTERDEELAMLTLECSHPVLESDPLESDPTRHRCGVCRKVFYASEARVAELEAEVLKYRRSLTAHHEIHTLSEAAIKESLGRPCQICARAQEAK